MTPETMTREQMTVAIAQDILAQIRRPYGAAPRFVTGYGYIVGDVPRIADLDGDLRDHADTVQSHCSVCMLGAALIAKARLFDSVPLSQIAGNFDFDPDETSIYISREGTVERLKDAIDPETLDMLEAAFEGSAYGIEDERRTNDIRGAAIFGRHWPNPTERAVAILENVVTNDGRLVVDPVTVDAYMLLDGQHPIG